MRYIVELAPGCYGTPFAPTVSRHRTWEAAVRRVFRSDRLVAVDTETGRRASIPQQNDPRLGLGRFGNGITLRRARSLGLL